MKSAIGFRIILAVAAMLALSAASHAQTFQRLPSDSLPTFQQAPQQTPLIHVNPATGIRPGGGAGGIVGGSTVAELTADECRKLGCTVITDSTCDAIRGEGGVDIKQRCVCSGGNSVCVNQR